MKRVDYYAVLGIPHEADEREVRSAYRGLAKRYHPDTGDGSSEEKFRAIQDAYDVLRDPEKRRQYDQECQPERGPAVESFSYRFSRFEPGFRASHVDLRYITRRQSPEPIRFGERRRSFEDVFEIFFFNR